MLRTIRFANRSLSKSSCANPLANYARQFSTEEPPVIIEKQGHVAIMRLNRPKVLNAMTVALGEGFSAAVADLRDQCANEDIRAVVVTGNGKAFSAGGDLQFLQDRHYDTPANNAPLMRAFYERFLCVRTLPVPVIAAINGPAVGAGLCFALACDIRLAAANAKLGLTFVGLNLHPGMASTHFLPLIVGPQVASEMLLTGKLYSGLEAERKGVVAEAVEGDVVVRMLRYTFADLTHTQVYLCHRNELSRWQTTLLR